MLFNLVTIGFLTHLIGYHLMLQHRGLTTFAYLKWLEDPDKKYKASIYEERKTNRNEVLEPHKVARTQ
jgi:hypothetical protein